MCNVRLERGVVETAGCHLLFLLFVPRSEHPLNGLGYDIKAYSRLSVVLAVNAASVMLDACLEVMLERS